MSLRKQTGFTIVELLVVIAVIGILASITVVGYGAWRKSAITTQVKSDLSSAATAMENERNFNSGYPTAIPSTVTPSKNVTLTPYPGGTATSYCIDGTSSDDPTVLYYVSSSMKDKGPIEGTCAGYLLPPVYNNQAIVTTLAGSAEGFADGTGTAAQFMKPSGIAVDSSGTVYVADRNNQRIRKITPSGVVTTLAGSSTPGNTDGTGTGARFSYLYGIAVDTSGTVYVADTDNFRIRKITPSGVVTTLAGSTQGFADGTGTAAQFNAPKGIAVDTSGMIYVSDSSNRRIRKITPSGVVTTLAGSTQGFADGTGTAAQFSNPIGIAVDSSGMVYVADITNNRIRKITPSGAVTTLAGSSTPGNTDGTGIAAQFTYPQGIAVDTSGTVYVADTANNRIRKITPSGVVTTLAGSTQGFANGTGTAAQFNEPTGIVINASGSFYVSDSSNDRIRKIE